MSDAPVILDSGHRRVFPTGAHRDRAAGKGDFSQLPFEPLRRVAVVFELGAAKYTRNNWRLGMPLSQHASSALRHSVKAAQGWTDEDHPAMAATNWFFFMETQRMIRDGILPAELDDIEDWLSKDGAARAMERIRAENAERETHV